MLMPLSLYHLTKCGFRHFQGRFSGSLSSGDLDKKKHLGVDCAVIDL